MSVFESDGFIICRSNRVTLQVDRPRPPRDAVPITIDLETGRLLARTELAEDGWWATWPMGGDVSWASRTTNWLLSNPTARCRIGLPSGWDAKQDAAALALRGRRRLHRGEYEPAVADLAASFDARPDPGVRRLLVQAFSRWLRFNYSRYAQQGPTAENLLGSSDEQLAFRRLRAAGLSRTGRVVEAFDEYLKLVSPMAALPAPENPPASRPTLPSGAIGSDRRGPVGAANSLAGLAVEEVDARTGDQKKTALAARRQRLFEEAVAANGMSGTTALAEFLTLFNGHPVADRARVKLLERLSENAPVVERETVAAGSAIGNRSGRCRTCHRGPGSAVVGSAEARGDQSLAERVGIGPVRWC
ncbi:MAG: hypothetical protein Ct9H300mP1_27650 [Planctomycetaceae bacterium]|nr:MAG: hypothetical protein Ct9H300mP1_27650 [Planctomycetaceae bacterium]